MNKETCKKCGVKKVKIWKGARNGHSKRYVDAKGSIWSGRTCPQCNIRAISGFQAKARRREKKEEVVVKDLDPMTTRKCRECGKRLPSSRYFAHYECAEKVNASEGTGVYTSEDWGYGVSLGSSETLTFKVSEMNLLGAQ